MSWSALDLFDFSWTDSKTRRTKKTELSKDPKPSDNRAYASFIPPTVSRCKNRSCKHHRETGYRGQFVATIVSVKLGLGPILKK